MIYLLSAHHPPIILGGWLEELRNSTTLRI